MAISSPFYRAPQRGDWQSSMERARGPLYRDADPGMVVEPLADPGNVTPSTQYPTQPQQNAQEMQDIWRVGGQNALTQPLLQLLMQRPDLMQQFLRQNQLMMQP
jgi:hypothetical protein